MARFAYVKDGVVVEYRDYPSQPECKQVDGINVIRPVVESDQPVYDSNIEELVKTVTITPTEVQWSWGVAALPPEQVAINLARVERRARLANRQPDAVPVTWGDLKDLLDELGL